MLKKVKKCIKKEPMPSSLEKEFKRTVGEKTEEELISIIEEMMK